MAALYTTGFAVVAGSLLQQYGFSLDDSYIYQTVARGLARGIPGFSPGQRLGGATSFAWVYLQAANFRWLHADPVVFNLVLSWLLLLAIGMLLLTLARQDHLPAAPRWVLAATPALCGNLLWLGLIGMEHLFFLALSLAAIYFWFSTETSASRSRTALLTGAALGLLAITRPEAIALGPLLLLAGTRAAKRTRTDALRAGVLWLLGVAAYFSWTWRNFHALLPDTFKGREWMWFRPYGGPHTAKAIAEFFRQWLQRLPRQFSAHFVDTQMRLTAGNRLFTLLVVVLLALIITGVVALRRMRPTRISFLLLWAAVHAGIYLVLLPTSGHGGRYQPLFLLLLFPLIFLGLLRVLEKLPTLRPHATAVLCIIIVVSGTASLTAWRNITSISTQLINQTHGQMAEWLRANLPPATAIGSFDSGRISYSLDRPITDLGGLADSTLLPYLTSGRVADYLRLHHIQYFTVPELEGQDERLFYAAPPQVRSVAQFCVSRPLFQNGYTYTQHAWRCQHLYQITH